MAPAALLDLAELDTLAPTPRVSRRSGAFAGESHFDLAIEDLVATDEDEWGDGADPDPTNMPGPWAQCATEPAAAILIEPGPYDDPFLDPVVFNTAPPHWALDDDPIRASLFNGLPTLSLLPPGLLLPRPSTFELASERAATTVDLPVFRGSEPAIDSRTSPKRPAIVLSADRIVRGLPLSEPCRPADRVPSSPIGDLPNDMQFNPYNTKTRKIETLADLLSANGVDDPHRSRGRNPSPQIEAMTAVDLPALAGAPRTIAPIVRGVPECGPQGLDSSMGSISVPAFAGVAAGGSRTSLPSSAEPRVLVRVVGLCPPAESRRASPSGGKPPPSVLTMMLPGELRDRAVQWLFDEGCHVVSAEAVSFAQAALVIQPIQALLIDTRALAHG